MVDFNRKRRSSGSSYGSNKGSKSSGYGNKRKASGGGGRGSKTNKPSEYYPVLSAFMGYPDDNDRAVIRLKPLTDRDGDMIESEVTEEQWVEFCRLVYRGEAALSISVWLDDQQYTMASGNLRLTDLDLALVEGKQTKAKKAPAKSTSTKRSKPQYEIPEDTDEEDADYEEVEEGDDDEEQIPF